MTPPKRVRFSPVLASQFPKRLEEAARLERWGFHVMASAARKAFASHVRKRDTPRVQLTVR